MPNSVATFVKPSFFAAAAMALPCAASGERIRQKYEAVEWSNEAWPVVEKIGMWACWKSGTTAVASSEPPPSTPTSELDDAISRFAAGTASAGSPFASTGVHVELMAENSAGGVDQPLGREAACRGLRAVGGIRAGIGVEDRDLERSARGGVDAAGEPLNTAVARAAAASAPAATLRSRFLISINPPDGRVPLRAGPTTPPTAGSGNTSISVDC